MRDLAAERLLMTDAFVLDAEMGEPTDGPRTVDTPVVTVAGSELGLWQIEVGEAEDVEVDEVFLVLAGAGRVTFSDGSKIDLHPGVLVRLHQGDETTWVIDEPLRKFYVSSPS